MPAVAFWLFFGLVAVLKIGIAGVGPNFLIPLRSAAAALPVPDSSFSTSLGAILLMRLAGTPSSAMWWAMGGVGLLLVVGALLWASRRLGPWAPHAAVILLGSSAFATLLSMLGHYDLFTVGGSVLVVLARSRIAGVLGACIACLGNPEQALVAALAMLVVAFVLQSSLRLRGVAFMTVAFMSVVGTMLWARTGDLETRGDLLVSDMAFAVRLFLGSWPVYAYSLMGPLWLVMAALLFWKQGRRMVLAIGLGLGIPLLATVVTLDVTRVFVATSTAAFLTLLHYVWTTGLQDQEPPRWLLPMMAVLMIIMPSIVILPEPSGFLRLPYTELLTFLGWPADWGE